MKNNKGLRRSLKYIALVIILLLVIAYLLLNPDFSVKYVLELTPKNPVYAAIVLLLLYAIKSATVFFPLILLEITCFSSKVNAVAVNNENSPLDYIYNLGYNGINRVDKLHDQIGI